MLFLTLARSTAWRQPAEVAGIARNVKPALAPVAGAAKRIPDVGKRKGIGPHGPRGGRCAQRG